MFVKFEEYRQLDGLALAELVRSGQVSAQELLDTAWARLEAVNPKLNFLVTPLRDRAQEQVKRKPSGPFAGVPFLTKDLFQDIAGVPNYNGCRALRQSGHVASQTATLTQRWLNAGVVVLGTTNTPEFGSKGVTEPAVSGVTANPWNLAVTPGGSSGGSAAAVAAGVVPLAGANDGGGSIRIPAACCGLFGLKPGRGRNPWGPQLSEYMHGGVMGHVLTRSVRDSAAMLDATHVPEPGAPYPAPPKARPYMEEILASPGKLRIAWSAETPSGRPIHPEIQAALERTATLLKGLGHEVVEKGLGIDYRKLYTARAPLSGANFAAGMQRLIEEVGREPEPHELEPLTWASLKGGRKVTGAQAIYALQELRMMNRQTLSFFEDWDVYLCPVLGTPVPRVGHIDPVNLEPVEVNRRQGEAFPFTPPFNFSGQPSLSLPLEQDSQGLPIGMMFTARYADEATLFRLAAQLEKEAPWNSRRPRLWN